MTPTPIPNMDATVETAVETAIGSFQTAALGQLGTLIPVAMLLTISVAVVYFVVKHFRGLSHT